MKIYLLPVTVIISVVTLGTGISAAFAQEAIEEIVVTARYRQENLQNTPIAITAFDSARIEAAGITDVHSFINLTPNFFARETFRSGVTFLTIRGITTGQQGFAPISYVVDGVKASSIDAVNQGVLFDLERVEVLKGPQSALYGAGAIAGAVNVITKKPTDTFEGQVKPGYAEGDDFTFKGSVSGPIVENTVSFRLSGYYRNTDGLVDTITGDDLDFEEQGAVRGRLLITPNDAVNLEFRVAYSEIEAGAAKQESFHDINLLNTFNNQTQARRGIIGEENRDIFDVSAKIDIELPFATLTSVSGYHEMDQDLYGSASWIRPPALGEPPVIGLFGPIYGENAVEPAMGFGPMGPTGQAIDHFQDLVDDFEIFTQDVRLTSNTEGSFRWVAGFEYIDREIINGLTLGTINPQNTSLTFVNRFDERNDTIWGAYIHLSLDITENMEVAISGRYDEDDYSTGLFNPATGETISSLDENGMPVDKLDAKDSKFQPKVTLSYDWSENLHTYLTYSEGYRFGFFNTGNLTNPEKTKNYEFGLKTNLLDGRASFNGAVFYIDYSNQQLTSVTSQPPFRLTTNIPESDVLGFEIETTLRVTDDLGLSAGVGYLDTEISELNRRLDAVPKVTANVAADYIHEIGNDLDIFGRVSWRHQGSFILRSGVFNIHAIDLLDIRLGLQKDNWSVTGFAKNVLDEQFASDATDFGVAFVRSYSPPSSLGVELGYRF
jgi:iron complex outermembrane receptor protein